MTGQQLKATLAELHIEQAEVARRIGISPQAFSNRLNAKQVKADFIQQIEKAINKSVYSRLGNEIVKADVQEVAPHYGTNTYNENNRRYVQYFFEAIFHDKLFFDIGTTRDTQRDFEEHYEKLAEFLFIPRPNFSFGPTELCSDDDNLENMEASAIFELHNLNYAQVRAFEDIFKSIAYYKKSVDHGYAHLDFRINLMEDF